MANQRSFSESESTHRSERECSCSVQSSGSSRCENSDYNEQSVGDVNKRLIVLCWQDSLIIVELEIDESREL